MTAWQNSTRRKRLPPNWATLRTTILKRDNHTCRIQGPNCTQHATEVDHIQHGDNHHPNNLQATCHNCHTTKTQAESMAVRHPRTRPPEPHPGLATP